MFCAPRRSRGRPSVFFTALGPDEGVQLIKFDNGSLGGKGRVFRQLRLSAALQLFLIGGDPVGDCLVVDG